ncbi:T9SS type A sorting domain-containing protein [Hymenobacter daeguensis]
MTLRYPATRIFDALKALLPLLLLLGGPGARAQAPAWQLAVASGPLAGYNAEVHACTTDAAGNVWVAGNFQGTVSFGTTTLSSTSGFDIDGFVAKWSPVTGTFVWAQQLRGIYEEHVLGVAVAGGNVYVAGDFSSPTVSCGTVSIANTGGTQRSSDGFLVKLADAGPTGTCQWVQDIGGVSGDLATAVAASGSSVYVTGWFSDPILTVGSTRLANAGVFDMYLAKFTDAGATATPVWAQRAGGPGAERPNALAVRGPAVYVGGDFQGNTATFGNTVLTNAGYSDAFIARLTDAGSSASFDWAQRGGGARDETVTGLTATATGVYATGNFSSITAAFGAGTLTSSGSNTGFVTRVLDQGTSAAFAWSQQTTGSGVCQPWAVCANGTSVYMAGSFSGTVRFGGSTATSVALYDVFVARLTDAGTAAGFAWVQQGGGPGFDFGYGLALGATRVYLAGSGSTPATFGPFALTQPSGGTQVAFIAALTDPTLTATASALVPAGIHLAPNPAHGRATVLLPAGTGRATITVLDALGRVRLSQPAGASANSENVSAELDLAGLAPGFYTVTVQAGPYLATRRLLVE